jgi:hypothetical protein
MTEQRKLPKVFVDFHNCDRQGRVRLNTVGTIQDLNRQGITLQEGIEMTFGNLELETEGIVTYSTEEGLWVAKFDWDSIRELPGYK